MHKLFSLTSAKFKRAICLFLVMANIFCSYGVLLAEEIGDETDTTSAGSVETTLGEVNDNSDVEETSQKASETTGTAVQPSVTPVPTPTAIPDISGSDDIVPSGITIRNASGSGYMVTVSYGPETGIPADAELVVTEIPAGDVYDEYLDMASGALNIDDIRYARLFDISLIKDGSEIEPAEGTAVAVKIVLTDAKDRNLSVVHLPEGSDAEVVDASCSNVRQGTELTFDADGFSAYAIVEGPAVTDVQTGWRRINTLEELAAHSDEVYFGNKDCKRYLTNEQCVIKNTRTGILKTPEAPNNYPDEKAAAYVFESAGNNKFKIYTTDKNGEIKYIKQSGDSLALVGASDATTFDISYFDEPSDDTMFRIKGANDYCINLQGKNSGSGFAAYNDLNDKFSKLALWYYDYQSESVDPYDLDGKTVGLIYYKSGASGAGLMASSTTPHRLDALSLPVLTERENHDDKLFVPDDTDLTMWTFTWYEDDRYYITTVVDGATKYLNIDSSGYLSISDNRQTITVEPGEGDYSGKIMLRANGYAVEYSGDFSSGFNTVNSSSNSDKKWLSFVEPTTLTDQYVLPYSARKISVSDESLKNGDRIIIYTRVWNDTAKRYDFYAIDHEGNLHPCFEDGDEIQWIDDRINTLLWDLTVYYYDDDNPTKANENHYYELYNEYSEQYIRPNAVNGQALGNGVIGINLLGRNDNKYYTQIVAWDDDNYAYAGIKTDMTDRKIVSYPIVEGISEDESIDFYFARVNTPSTAAVLHPVDTVDNTLHGITMKITDFKNGSWTTSEQTKFLNSSFGGNDGHGGYTKSSPGILSNTLGPDGYPTVTSGTYKDRSLAELYSRNGLMEANHLFIDSTYRSSGYFVYDSSQNFAAYDKSTGNFTVYQELGTHDAKDSPSVKHGQFFPFNTIDPNIISSKNPTNLYTSLLDELDESNPRKYENLYKINNPDYQFGVELKTSFVQTPNGFDDWGHDIIYEFTGDDDFWLYVDGELVIDLGGVHSALYGSINYATGKVQVQNDQGKIRNTTLYEIFEEHYRTSGEHTEQEVQDYLDGLFVKKTKGNEEYYVFKDYTSHTMRVFYMERGQGASNLNMRFNQSSVRAKSVVLSKELDGVEHPEKFNAEFPYQIYYKLPGQTEYNRVQNSTENISVVYRGTNRPVKYDGDYTIDGIPYADVFFLKPGEACEIKLPDEIIDYYIVECGVDPYVFDDIKANDVQLTGTPVTNSDREDYAIVPATAKDRTSVKFVNHVNATALRTLTFTKRLWDEGGLSGNEITDDDTPFSFRLYLATEHETGSEVKPANMYTYHVKDPQGRYCRWDSSLKKFVPIRDDATAYSGPNGLTDAEKQQASFTTSMNGSISKIPAGYTVEVRELLAGAKYKVEERYNEMPDGYSRIQYDVNNDGTIDIETTETVNTIVKGKDPHVDVHNIRGFAIRMYKEFTDENFVSSRENTYFAVYKDDVLDPDSVYQLKFKKNSLYWYYVHLDTGLTLDDYVIKEVKLTGADVEVDPDDGKVTNVTSLTVTPVAEGGEITLTGSLKGESTTSDFKYKVHYGLNVQKPTNNMRIETIKNEREGIKIFKKYKTGESTEEPLAGAQFDIREKGSQVSLGTFISQDDGFVTFAYLRKNVEYTITETKAPSGYSGLKKALTIVMDDDGKITVTADPSTADKDNLRFTYVQGPDDPTVTIYNFKYDFKIYKLDKDTREPVEGVKFELHRQRTVGGVTVVDFQAMADYDNLLTDADGVVPKINSTLPKGTYELREVDAGNTHQGLNYYILFTVTETGDIILNEAHPEITVEEKREVDPLTGELRIKYNLLIFNYSADGDLKLSKTVAGSLGDETEVFPMTVTFKTASNTPYVGTIHIQKNGGIIEDYNITSTANGVVRVELSHGDYYVFSALDDGTKFTITEQTKGYQSKGYLDDDTDPVSTDGTVSGDIEHNSLVRFVNSRDGIIPTGLKTSFNLSVSILCAMAAGLVVRLVYGYRKRRRYADYEE